MLFRLQGEKYWIQDWNCFQLTIAAIPNRIFQNEIYPFFSFRFYQHFLIFFCFPKMWDGNFQITQNSIICQIVFCHVNNFLHGCISNGKLTTFQARKFHPRKLPWGYIKPEIVLIDSIPYLAIRPFFSIQGRIRIIGG